MPKSSFDGKAVGPDYRIIGKKIGAGNFGEVYLGKLILQLLSPIIKRLAVHFTGENIHTNQRVAVKIEKQHQAKTSR